MGRSPLAQALGLTRKGWTLVWELWEPREASEQVGTFLAVWGIGPGGDSPCDGVTSQPGPPQAPASAGGTLVMWEGAPAPLTSPFFFAGPGGHAQRYVFGKGRAEPRRPLLARWGMAGRGG